MFNIKIDLALRYMFPALVYILTPNSASFQNFLQSLDSEDGLSFLGMVS